MARLFLLASIVAEILAPAASAATQACGPLTDRDEAAIRADIEAYRTRWLAGDAEGVMRTFVAEPVLMPPQSAPPVVGQAAVRRFWWPPGPQTKVTKLTITVAEVGGDCQVAWVRGLDEVEWLAGTQVRGNAGTYLNVMRKLPDGAWRISHHMWDDDPARRR